MSSSCLIAAKEIRQCIADIEIAWENGDSKLHHVPNGSTPMKGVGWCGSKAF
jgi:hypothetical protein